MNKTWTINSEDFIGITEQNLNNEKNNYWKRGKSHTINTTKIIKYKKFNIYIGYDSCIIEEPNKKIKAFNVYESTFYDVINNMLIGFGRDTIEYYNLDTEELTIKHIR